MALRLCFCGLNDEDGGQSSRCKGHDALRPSLHILPAINADIAAGFLLDSAKPRHNLSQVIKDWGQCTHIFNTVLLLHTLCRSQYGSVSHIEEALRRPQARVWNYAEYRNR